MHRIQPEKSSFPTTRLRQPARWRRQTWSQITLWPLACAGIAVCWLALAAPARGSTVGFSAQFASDLNPGSSSPWLINTQSLVAADRPLITIKNTSDSGIELTNFTLTMGDSAYSFGSLLFLTQYSTIDVTDFVPIATPGMHAGSPYVGLTFSGFGPNETYKFRADIDRNIDHGASLTQFGQALASGNDPTKWASIDVTFSNGMTLHHQLTPDEVSGSGFYQYYYCWYATRPVALVTLQTQDSTQVPEPATASLGALAFVGLLAFGYRARRKRR